MKSERLDGMVAIFEDVAKLLQKSENDFAWSGWENEADALNAVDALIVQLQGSSLPEQSTMSVLFAPTGPIQEVSLNSGWSSEFVVLAKRFDAELTRIMPDSRRTDFR